VPVADLVFERAIDLPRVIVWDALVDPELLAGWLGEVRSDPIDGRLFTLTPGTGDAPLSFELVHEERPNRLAARAADGRLFEFELTEVEGGSRGTSTSLALRILLDFHAAFAGGMRREWETSLDDLVELLRGHPVDWTEVRNSRGTGASRPAPGGRRRPEAALLRIFREFTAHLRKACADVAPVWA
jgi:uncharacterized protein YndB with AHSA1/START domain